MNAEYSNTQFKNLATALNFFLLFIHVLLLHAFVATKIYAMAYFNILSLIFYGFSFFLINKKHAIVYVTLALCEIFLHMIAATICVGWNAGFALYTFGTLGTVYYTKYIYSDYKGSSFLSILISTISVLSFVILWALSLLKPPLYNVSDFHKSILFLFNTIVSFGLQLTLLYKFTSSAIRHEKKLYREADFDELTQLYNRHKMREILENVQSSAEVSGSRNNYFTCIIDIDDFKIVNDTYGHEAGDAILQHVSAIILEKIREEGAYLCRWGGEEFLIVRQYKLNDPEELENCKKLINNIHNEIKCTPYNYNGNKITTSITSGAAVHQKGETIKSTIDSADRMLYKGKMQGKNCFVM